MELKTIIEKRRSVRKFTDKEVSPEVLRRIVDAAIAAPSSRNSHSSSFIVVRDRGMLERIATMRDYGSAFVKDAPAMILVVGDTTVTDLWQVNAAISATVLQLAVVDEGLASCWVHVDGRPQLQAEPDGAQAIDRIREVVEIPEGCEILCGIALGYSEFQPKPLPEFDRDSKVTIL